ncbi:MAG: hypothetical protein ACK53L_24270, partial [Pirellulaceae bacterium]
LSGWLELVVADGDHRLSISLGDVNAQLPTSRAGSRGAGTQGSGGDDSSMNRRRKGKRNDSNRNERSDNEQ